MILIDSLYINNSGGKILLDYLVQELEKNKVNAFYLFDKRVENDYHEICSQRKLYIKATLYNRHKFYRLNKHKFQKVFCFGNIPPLSKQKCEVITYFHQQLYVTKAKDHYIKNNYNIIRFLRLRARQLFLSYLRRNSDYWFVQLKFIRHKLHHFYNIDKNKILVKPFYPPIRSANERFWREPYTYLYVSSGAPHKNHKRLISAFCKFYDEHGKGKLTLTISDEFPEINKVIKEKQEKGFPIINLGFIKRDNLYKHYQAHQFLIFPSMAESFGLGIVEAIENGNKVIGADLPYLKNVCTPSLSFNPFEEQEIYQAFKDSLNSHIPETILHIKNHIKDIIKVLN